MKAPEKKKTKLPLEKTPKEENKTEGKRRKKGSGRKKTPEEEQKALVDLK